MIFEDLVLNKKIAKLRHCHTIYDKNINLMYDENGNQTELRKEINYLLYKIASGELGTSYLSGVNSEIKYAKKKFEEKNKPTKNKKKKREPTITEQQAALWKGVNKMQTKVQENQNKQRYLCAIGMLKCQLQMSYRNALPNYINNKQGKGVKNETI